MKKIKKVLLVMILFVSIITLSGCGSKKSISAEEFKNIMEKKKYVVSDATNQFSDYNFVKKVYIATDSKYKYQIEFYEFENDENAIASYQTNKTNIESMKSNVSKKQLSANGNNYTKYYVTTNGRFMATTRIDKTVLFVNVDESSEKEVKELIKELGY